MTASSWRIWNVSPVIRVWMFGAGLVAAGATILFNWNYCF